MISTLIRKILNNPKKAVYKLHDTVLDYSYRPLVVLSGCLLGSVGQNIFSQDWDVLIILDTCRIDAIQEVSEEYAFINDINEVRSVGAVTSEWLAATFTDSHINIIHDTTYLSANGCAQEVLENDRPSNLSLTESHLTYRLLSLFNSVSDTELLDFENIWMFEPTGEDGPRGHREGGPPPRYVTDRAITHGRQGEQSRLICHYHQPHAPHTANAVEEDRELYEHERNVNTYIKQTGDYESVWETYLDELRYALDDIELLLSNIDADEVIITADHGNAFGELGVWGHPIGSLHPKIRNVPWVTTTATDTGEYEPSTPAPSVADQTTEKTVSEVLNALGYKF